MSSGYEYQTLIGKILKITILSSILYGCNSVKPVEPISTQAVDPVYTSEELNALTSRSRRNELACTVATTDGMNPAPRGVAGLLVDSANFGYADLYGDGSIETIAGFIDEMRKLDVPGNKERSREISQYMFFSPDPSFEAPADTEFMMARSIIPSDLNGDGIDDVVFVQHGPDYRPYNRMPVKVMLSSPVGYSVKTVANTVSLNHGGAIGDIDNDGDLDIVVTPTPKREIIALINDGTGNFKRRVLERNSSKKYYNVQLWDIDGDGNLDMIADGHDEPITVFWGENGRFSKTTTLELKPSVMSDAVFGDFNKDGKLEVVTLSSLADKSKRNSWYNGFSIDSYTVTGRTFERKNLHTYQTENARTWIPYINACDLKNDGDLDLVMINNSRQLLDEWSGLGKFVLENDGNGNFIKYVFREKNMSVAGFPPKYYELAKEVGISVDTYVPAQTYWEGDESEYICTICNGKDGLEGKNSLAAFEIIE